MKQMIDIIKRKLRRILGSAVVPTALAGVSLALFTPSANAQLTPTTVTQLTNLPALFLGATTTNLFTTSTNAAGIPTNNVIQLWQGSGMVFAAGISNTVSTGGALVINYALSWDGTNWVYPPYGGVATTNTATGTTPLFNGTNVVPASLNNFAYASPYSIQCTALTGTNIQLLSAFVSKAYNANVP